MSALLQNMMPTAEIDDLLAREHEGHLATKNPDGTPYIVTLNYRIIDDMVVLHCAKEGQKIDNIKNDEHVCFSVSSGDRCVIIRGRARFVEDFAEKSRLLYIFTEIFMDGQQFSLSEQGINRTCVLAIDIEEKTGVLF